MWTGGRLSGSVHMGPWGVGVPVHCADRGWPRAVPYVRVRVAAKEGRSEGGMGEGPHCGTRPGVRGANGGCASGLLASPTSAIHQGTLCDYRTGYVITKARRTGPPRWTATTAQAWQLSKRGIAQRGSKVRHLWDLRWHGENQAIAAAGLADHLAACPLWGHSPCSQSHILCDCPGLTHERAGLHLDFRILAGQLARGHGAPLLPPRHPGAWAVMDGSLDTRATRPSRALPAPLHPP